MSQNPTNNPGTTEEKIDSMFHKIIRIETVLIGIPGTDEGGLSERVKTNTSNITKIKARLNLLIGILLGSGVLTGAGIGIDKLIRG